MTISSPLFPPGRTPNCHSPPEADHLRLLPNLRHHVLPRAQPSSAIDLLGCPSLLQPWKTPSAPLFPSSRHHHSSIRSAPSLFRPPSTAASHQRTSLHRPESPMRSQHPATSPIDIISADLRASVLAVVPLRSATSIVVSAATSTVTRRLRSSPNTSSRLLPSAIIISVISRRPRSLRSRRHLPPVRISTAAVAGTTDRLSAPSSPDATISPSLLPSGLHPALASSSSVLQ